MGVVEASVSCPCNEGGKVLDLDTARARILSQMIALRMPEWRVQSCWNAHSFIAPLIPAKWKSCFYMKWFMTKASFSVMLMLSCWRKHCAGGGPQLNTDLDLEW